MVVFDAGAYGSVMASNYNRRPMPAEVLVQDGEATRDQAPSDHRRPRRARELTDAGVSHRLRRARSERQADPGRDAARRADRAGRSCELLSFPDYQTAIGSEIHRALHGERDYPADVMQLLYVANRYETRKRIDSWLAEGRVISATATRHRASRTARRRGSMRAWLADIQRFLPAADLTILLDIPPEVAVAAQTRPTAIATNATSTC